LEQLSKNLKFLRLKEGKNQAEMSAQLGFSRGAWNNYERGESNPTLSDFIRLSKYFGVGETQLLHFDLEQLGNLLQESEVPYLPDKGNLTRNPSGNLSTKKSMLPKVVTIDNSGRDNVVYVPVKARAGYLNGYGDPVFIQTLPAYSIPGLNHGTFRMFEVSGHSMGETLYDGDAIVGTFVENPQQIRDSRVHVIVTRHDGVVVKRVLNRLESDGKLILKSDNIKDKADYPNIVVEPDDILEIWYGVLKFSRYFKEPTELYKRVTDLEGKLILLEHTIQAKLK
jgi:transcriptional regulator with XRE-family HTH domain/signal peptidase I